jgi:hypothetical protein
MENLEAPDDHGELIDKGERFIQGLTAAGKN